MSQTNPLVHEVAALIKELREVEGFPGSAPRMASLAAVRLDQVLVKVNRFLDEYERYRDALERIAYSGDEHGDIAKEVLADA